MASIPEKDPESGYLKGILDALPDQIAVIDEHSVIEWVNNAWERFYQENGGSRDITWSGLKYLACCEHEDVSGDPEVAALIRGVRGVLDKSFDRFDFAYPCDSPAERRWFLMSVVPVTLIGPPRFVVTHRNITEEKLAQEQLKELVVTDALTGMHNRRYFNEQFDLEWRRAERNCHELSLIYFDVDFFKQINDTLGHVAGDQCLKAISTTLKRFARRPGDVAARIGGDEFAMLLANTPRHSAEQIARQIQVAIADLDIILPQDHASAHVTLSIGIATALPRRGIRQRDLLTAADDALYEAKRNGRNRISIADGAPSPDLSEASVQIR
ncbi:sensor domain-containing diguanylate cyclase [Pelagibius sp. Alg239-R121]|uniref:sensor domain-containing diguanylate cyclase n=1 Tax=Pelagibius sp. Alg239-R121 TaxID=2993448 RepID=UPI0024A66108|nr:sensor domain-containing diguanylate cyclase [Pelagibius sp. Alg239-R121]